MRGNAAVRFLEISNNISSQGRSLPQSRSLLRWRGRCVLHDGLSQQSRRPEPHTLDPDWGGCPPSFSCVGEGFGVPSPASKDDGMIQPTDVVVLSAKGVGDVPWHVWSPLAGSARCEIQSALPRMLRGRMLVTYLLDAPCPGHIRLGESARLGLGPGGG